MWEQVKPITLEIKQINEDDSFFIYNFYSFDSELVKISEAVYYDENGYKIGCYSRLLEIDDKCKLSLNFFTSKLNKSTTNKLVEYFENPRLFVEFL